MAKINKTLPIVSFLVACDSASPDPNSGKVTLYGVFDKFTVPSLPQRVQFCIFARFLDGSGSHEIEIEFIDSHGKRTDKNVPKFKIECQPGRSHELLLMASGLEIKKKGRHHLRFVSNGKPVGQPYRIEVEIKDQVRKSPK